MGRPEYYYIMAFDTTTDAMKAERHAKERIKAAIMPIPGAISSGCGLALRFMEEDEESILAFCKDAPVNGHLYKLFTQKVDGHHPVFLIM